MKTGSKIVIDSKFLEFILVLSSSVRQGRMDEESILTIFRLLRALIVAQSNAAEKAFQIQMDKFLQSTSPPPAVKSAGSSTVKTKSTPSTARRVSESKSEPASTVSSSSSSSSSSTLIASTAEKKKAVAVALPKVEAPSVAAPVVALPKDKLRPLLERAWNYLVTEDKEKIFLHRASLIS